MVKGNENINISLLSDNENLPRPRLSKLIIKNFRSIEEVLVTIDLDEIVVLVDANNAKKNSIL